VKASYQTNTTARVNEEHMESNGGTMRCVSSGGAIRPSNLPDTFMIDKIECSIG
jgi:hypothetical protein